MCFAMRSTAFALVLGACLPAGVLFAADSDFNGRWTIAPNDPADTNGRAMWLEIAGAGSDSLKGKAVGLQPGGQLDPISDPRIEHGELYFEVERPVGRGDQRRMTRTPTRVELKAGQLYGTTEMRGGSVQWIGRRSPEIADRDDGSWKPGEPVALFEGGDLSQWETLHPGRLEKDWYVEGGVTKNREHADVLVSKRKFWNFRLQAEYRVHPEMNGGIGLRGRYEIQILDDHGHPPSKSGNGALYSRVPPVKNASKPAGEWQTFDITLIGRDLTVVLNGEKILDKVTVEGFTAMASDWREDQPGPITLQGDHGAVEFRKIVVTPLEK